MKNQTLNQEELLLLEKTVTLKQKEISTGGMVYLICPITTIRPEELAMIQSLYSRDPASVIYHLLEVAEKGAAKFMQQFYVEYNHKSIGDCGNILLAFEGVSMLAAKAIQDNQLYAGQEASTRYLNFSNQKFISSRPNASKEEIKILENWRKFYLENLPLTQNYTKEQNPFESFDLSQDFEEPEKVWKKTMNARAFDVMRGFLPAGATTCVAWWGSISNIGDHLSWLRCHSLPEVSELALATEEILREQYPSSFGRRVVEKREEYKKNWFNKEYYLTPDKAGLNNLKHNFQVEYKINPFILDEYKDAILNRPQGVDLPYQIGEAFHLNFAGYLDFASYRDLQRHRAVIQRMGLITAEIGFHQWYIDNLPTEIQDKAKDFINEQLLKIHSLELSEQEKQYLMPMGMKIPVRLTGSLSKFVYLLELRSRKTVHPTLHRLAYDFASKLKYILGKELSVTVESIPLFVDSGVGEIDLKRGTQDIVRK